MDAVSASATNSQEVDAEHAAKCEVCAMNLLDMDRRTALLSLAALGEALRRQDAKAQRNDQDIETGDVRVVASGRSTVNVTQQTVANQSITEAEPNYQLYDGAPASVCDAGMTRSDPVTGTIYFQKDDCCWHISPCCLARDKCKGGRCPRTDD